ncbi:MAG: hypothetical protein HFG62_17190 [Lachnospiraceae bacterium]|nr:hypothetical protein [Lachnospiraceae bacterium]
MNTAMIVELKYGHSAQEAVRQRNYPEDLQEYHGNLLLAGINYDKESREHSCVIEEWEEGEPGYREGRKLQQLPDFQKASFNRVEYPT